METNLPDLSPEAVEAAFTEVTNEKKCGGIAEQVEQGALRDFPGLGRALELIQEENLRRGIPDEFSHAIYLGAQIMAVTFAKTTITPESYSSP